MSYLCCCKLHVVEQSTVGVLETWGKFNRVLEPGFYCIGFGQALRGLMSLRIEQLNVKCETKTKDNVFVTLVASIQYRTVKEKVENAFYTLYNPHRQIEAYVNDVLRGGVPKLDLDSVFLAKNDLAKDVETQLEKAMSAYGYEIVHTLIVDIEPDARVKAAMNDINAAQRQRVAATDKAEAEKILQVKRAEAEAETKYLSGVGVARQREAIVTGLRDSILAFSNNVPGTTPKEVLDMVLLTQYFDTMKDIGASSKNTTLFLPHGPGTVADLSSQIREGMLTANSAQTMHRD